MTSQVQIEKKYEKQEVEMITIMLSASTYSLSSRVLRTKGGFFFCPSGRPVLVAVFAFLEKVGKAGSFIQLEIEKEGLYSAFKCYLITLGTSRHSKKELFYLKAVEMLLQLTY